MGGIYKSRVNYWR